MAKTLNCLDVRLAEARAMVAFPPFEKYAEHPNNPDWRAVIVGATADGAGGWLHHLVYDPAKEPPRDLLDTWAADAPHAAVYGGDESERLRCKHYAINRPAIEEYSGSLRPQNLYDPGPDFSGLAVVVGTGPSLAGQAELLWKARQAGAAIIGLNQVADYLDSRMFDYYVVMTPRAEPIWWLRDGMPSAKKLAFIGVNPYIAQGEHRELHWFSMGCPGTPWFTDAWRRSPRLPLLSPGASVVMPAFSLACRLRGVTDVALVGIDLSYHGGLERPGHEDSTKLGFMVPDVAGRPVKTNRQLWGAFLSLTAAASFRVAAGVRVWNAGGQGLLGSVALAMPDGRDASIKVRGIEDLIRKETNDGE